MAKRFQVLRGKLSAIPTLMQGEFGYAVDANQLYIGDGIINKQLAMRDSFRGDTTITNEIIDFKGKPIVNLSLTDNTVLQYTNLEPGAVIVLRLQHADIYEVRLPTITADLTPSASSSAPLYRFTCIALNKVAVERFSI